MSAPLVSVIMITYNQRPYIEQAMQSVLFQETDYPFELVIGDDASTDGTSQLVREYAERYPSKIRAVVQRQNLRRLGKSNFASTLYRCRGRYVACLDGDDFWTHPKKLQRQVQLLESRPELALCFSSCSQVDEEGNLTVPDRVPERFRRNLTQTEILVAFGPPIMTVMFRRAALPTRLPTAFLSVFNRDSYMMALATANGDAGYLPLNTAAYRICGSGVWSTKTEFEKARLLVHSRRVTMQSVPLQRPAEIGAHICKRYENLLRRCQSEKQYVLFARYVTEYVAFSPLRAIHLIGRGLRNSVYPRETGPIEPRERL
jgi:glycosyltransferase involved in cell wall biosynthesis